MVVLKWWYDKVVMAVVLGGAITIMGICLRISLPSLSFHSYLKK